MVDGVSKRYVFNFKAGEEGGPFDAVYKARVVNMGVKRKAEA